MKIVIGITGASGIIYAQRLLDCIDAKTHEVHLLISNYAQAVIKQEWPQGLRIPEGVQQHSIKSMNAPFASGSNAAEAMAIIPCSMGTMGRIDAVEEPLCINNPAGSGDSDNNLQRDKPAE